MTRRRIVDLEAEIANLTRRLRIADQVNDRLRAQLAERRPVGPGGRCADIATCLQTCDLAAKGALLLAELTAPPMNDKGKILNGGDAA